MKQIIKLSEILDDIRVPVDESDDLKFAQLNETTQYVNMIHRHIEDITGVSIYIQLVDGEYAVIIEQIEESETSIDELVEALPTKWDEIALEMLKFTEPTVIETETEISE